MLRKQKKQNGLRALHDSKVLVLAGAPPLEGKLFVLVRKVTGGRRDMLADRDSGTAAQTATHTMTVCASRSRPPAGLAEV